MLFAEIAWMVTPEAGVFCSNQQSQHVPFYNQYKK